MIACCYLRFTYPTSDEANILFNFNFEFEENAPNMRGAFVRKVSDTEIEGYIKHTSHFADEYTVYFVAHLSKPMKEFTTWEALPFTGNMDLYGTDWQREVPLYKDFLNCSI